MYWCLIIFGDKSVPRYMHQAQLTGLQCMVIAITVTIHTESL